MSRARMSILAGVLTGALLGCGPEAEDPDPSGAAIETRAERVGMADVLDEVCGHYARGEGHHARQAIDDAVRADEDRTRADVERIVYAACGDEVRASNVQELADGERENSATQQEGGEQQREEFADRARGACTSEGGSDVVCTGGMAVTFDEGSCDLDEDPFSWFGSVLNLNDVPVDVTIIIEVVDDAGVRVGEGSAVVRHLQPGRESTFSTTGNHRVTDQGTCELAVVRVERY